MTQQTFDKLPLLLRYAQVVAVLSGLNRRAFIESIADGTLRRWPEFGGLFRMRYYLKADVAVMAGLQMRGPKLHQLNVWLAREDLLRALGLGRHYFNAAARLGLVRCDHEARPPWRLRLRVAQFLAVQPRSTHVDAGKTLTTDGHGKCAGQQAGRPAGQNSHLPAPLAFRPAGR